jgi:hypothetical protein
MVVVCALGDVAGEVRLGLSGCGCCCGCIVCGCVGGSFRPGRVSGDDEDEKGEAAEEEVEDVPGERCSDTGEASV